MSQQPPEPNPIAAPETGPDLPEPAGRARGVPPVPKRPDPRRPYHVGVAVGVVTTVYAATLVAASRLQLDADRDLIADRAPVQRALELLDEHHDWLEDSLGGARDQYSTGATGYTDLSDRMAKLQARLATVDRSVAAIEKLGNSMSLTLSLPVVPVARSHSSAGSSSGGGGGGGTTKAPAAAPPPPPPPPPTSGSTGASGAP